MYAISSRETERTIITGEIGNQAGRRLWQIEIAEDRGQNVTQCFGSTSFRESPETIRGQSTRTRSPAIVPEGLVPF